MQEWSVELVTLPKGHGPRLQQKPEPTQGEAPSYNGSGERVIITSDTH